MSYCACGVTWSKMPAVASTEMVRPSGLAFQTKFRCTTFGVRFLTTMRGLPGMNSDHARDMKRACASVPPPGLKPTIMLMVLPLKYASASKPGSTGNGVGVGRGTGVGVGAGPVSPLAAGVGVGSSAIIAGVGVGSSAIIAAVGVGVAAGRGVAVGSSSPPHAARIRASTRLIAPIAAIFLLSFIMRETSLHLPSAMVLWQLMAVVGFYSLRNAICPSGRCQSLVFGCVARPARIGAWSTGRA